MGPVCPPGHVVHSLETFLAGPLGMPLASRGWRPVMRLDMLQAPKIPPTPDSEERERWSGSVATTSKVQRRHKIFGEGHLSATSPVQL